MTRVLLDTNVWISLLLRRSKRSAIPQVIDIVFSSKVELIVPKEQISELFASVEKSAYLRGRISKATVETAVEQLYLAATVPPVIVVQGQFTRDPKDDYLIAYSLTYGVDYLVTGDLDLLALEQVGTVRIVTPNQFLERMQ